MPLLGFLGVLDFWVDDERGLYGESGGEGEREDDGEDGGRILEV